MAAALLAACSTQEMDIQTPVREEPIFYASFEQPVDEGTRVYATEDLLLRWTADDRVSIFNKNTYNQQYKFAGATGDNSGGFDKVEGSEFVTGNAITHVVSVYPYDAATRLSESETISLTLPAEQHYAENTFGLGANTMVSVSSDSFLQYKSIGGFLMFKLYGEGVSVSSITLKGNNGEKLAGKATVTMSLDGTPTTLLDDDATSEITLLCDAPVSLGATAEESTFFWFVIPPVSFSKGFTLTVTDTSGGVYEKSTSKSIAIERNKLAKMSPMNVPVSGVDDGWVTLSKDVLGSTKWGSDLNKVLDNKYYFKKLRIDTRVGTNLSWICMTFCSDIHPGFAAFWSQYRKTDVEYCYTGMNGRNGLNIDDDHPSFHLYGTEVSDHIIEFDFSSLAADTYIYSYQLNVDLSGVQVLPSDPPVVEDGTIIVSYQVEDCSTPTDILYDGLDVITGMAVDDGDIVSPEATYCFDRSGMHKIVWHLADKTKTKNVSFSGCQAVVAVYFSDSITEFSDDSARKGLLEGCLNLKKIHFPSQLTRIGVADFRDNSGLEGSIVLPDSVTWLDSYAFSHTNISSFTFGKGITTLGMCMFEDCPNLTEIYIYATTCPTHVEDWRDYPFFSHGSWHTGTLHYPQGSDYSQWLSTSPYWLGFFGWTGVDDL